MSILTMCSNAACGELLDVPDDAVGKKVRCPSCGTVQVIARESPVKPSAPAAPADAMLPPAETCRATIERPEHASAHESVTPAPEAPKNPPQKPAPEAAAGEGAIDLTLLDTSRIGEAPATPKKPPRKPAQEHATGESLIDLTLLDTARIGGESPAKAVAAPTMPPAGPTNLAADPDKPPETPSSQDAAGEPAIDSTLLDQSLLGDVQAGQGGQIEPINGGVLEYKTAACVIFFMGIAGIIGGAAAGVYLFPSQQIAGAYIGGALGWVAGFVVAFLFVLSVERPDDRLRCPTCGSFFPEGTEFCQWCGGMLTGQSNNPITRGGMHAGAYGIGSKRAIAAMALLGLIGGAAAEGVHQAAILRSDLDGGLWALIGVVGLGLAYLCGYFLEFLLSGVGRTLRLERKTPPLPPLLSGRNFLAALGGLAVVCLYVVPLVTLPLLPLAMLYLSTAGIGKALNLKATLGAALRHSGDFTTLWLMLLLWVAGLLLALALAVAAFVCMDNIPALVIAGESVLANSVRMATWILVTAFKSAIVSTIVCIFGLTIARCIGLFGLMNAKGLFGTSITVQNPAPEKDTAESVGRAT